MHWTIIFLITYFKNMLTNLALINKNNFVKYVHKFNSVICTYASNSVERKKKKCQTFLFM